jgi:hypothetical protein
MGRDITKAKAPGNTPARDYEVGKGKPPKHTQFKKGEQRANRGGRPRKLTAEEQARRKLKELLEELVTIREGNRTMRVTAFEAYVRRLRASALSTGSIKAGREWLDLSTKFGALFSESDTGDIVPINHHEIVRRFLDRTRGKLPVTETSGGQQPNTKPSP